MIAGAFCTFGDTVWPRNVIAVLEVVSAERILDWTGITETSGSHTEADVLGKDARCNIHRERRHIRIDWHTTIPCALDVSGIIEQSLPV